MPPRREPALRRKAVWQTRQRMHLHASVVAGRGDLHPGQRHAQALSVDVQVGNGALPLHHACGAASLGGHFTSLTLPSTSLSSFDMFAVLHRDEMCHWDGQTAGGAETREGHTIVLDGDSEEGVTAGRHQLRGLPGQRGVGGDRRRRAQHVAAVCLARHTQAAQDGAPDIRHLWRVLQGNKGARALAPCMPLRRPQCIHPRICFEVTIGQQHQLPEGAAHLMTHGAADDTHPRI